MSTPSSIINICSGVRINSRYEHTIYFDTAAAQRNYFAGKTVKVFPAYSYLRKSWPLKVEASMEEAKTWNYLFFQNSSTGKIYYYFINTVEYVNDNTVELGLELDVMQTYMFDYELLPCYVDRHHAISDNIGENMVEEGLDTGEIADISCFDIDLGDLAIMVLATINPNGESSSSIKNALPYCYNGVFSGAKIWAVDGSRWAAWGTRLEALDEAGVTDGIMSMWMYPKNMIVLGGEAKWTDANICLPVERALDIEESIAAGEGLAYYIQKPQPGDLFYGTTSELDEFVPKNNKLYTYPYNFLYITNNQGAGAAFHYERFGGANPGFALSGALSLDGGVRLTPVNYDNLHINYVNGLMLGGFPSCAWDSDVYKMWLAQNQHTLAYNSVVAQAKVAGGVGSAIIGLFTGDFGSGLNTAISGAEQIGSQLAMKKDRAIEPPQAKGSFSTSVNITDSRHCFSVYRRCVNTEYARMIDDYFTMYGYKQSRIMVPQRDVRENFTYIKTIGCHIAGELCNEDMTKIEGIYDRGITFWIDGDEVGNYWLPNACTRVG